MAATMEMIAQGAEGRVFKTTFMQKPCILKERFSKKYRHPMLDEQLTKQRLSQEARSLQRCTRGGVITPAVYYIDTLRHALYMEYIDDAITIKALLRQTGDMNVNSELFQLLANQIGEALGRMHSVDVVHGDLTTSNMMLKGGKTLVMIDFGLSFVSSLTEDKAVDLYVLERAFLSTHPNTEDLFSAILAAYKRQYNQSSAILRKLED
eukprot:Ihof_evm20s13 gene=Ihof_evmTU20s13